jgi:hypothetical protein
LSPSATRKPRKKAAIKSPSLKSPAFKSPSPAFNQVTPRMSSKKALYSVDDLTTGFSAQINQGFVEEGLSSLQYGSMEAKSILATVLALHTLLEARENKFVIQMMNGLVLQKNTSSFDLFLHKDFL